MQQYTGDFFFNFMTVLILNYYFEMGKIFFLFSGDIDMNGVVEMDNLRDSGKYLNIVT